jgi:hypothetical protein
MDYSLFSKPELWDYICAQAERRVRVLMMRGPKRSAIIEELTIRFEKALDEYNNRKEHIYD